MIRCKSCKRFTKNNVALRGWDSIKEASGDCNHCGAGVPVEFDAWGDWGWPEDDNTTFVDHLVESTTNWATVPRDVTAQWPADSPLKDATWIVNRKFGT